MNGRGQAVDLPTRWSMLRIRTGQRV